MKELIMLEKNKFTNDELFILYYRHNANTVIVDKIHYVVCLLNSPLNIVLGRI